MEQIQRYKIVYTETSILDIEEKADYIAVQLRDPVLAERWYLRLRETIQKDLSIFPMKYPLYDVFPWNERGVRLFAARNDVILYHVDEGQNTVYICGVCTRGRDISAHLEEDSEPEEQFH